MHGVHDNILGYRKLSINAGMLKMMVPLREFHAPSRPNLDTQFHSLEIGGGSLDEYGLVYLPKSNL
eukprot:gene17021-12182_t